MNMKYYKVTCYVCGSTTTLITDIEVPTDMFKACKVCKRGTHNKVTQFEPKKATNSSTKLEPNALTNKKLGFDTSDNLFG
jgi:hypothetical protein